MPFSCPKIPGLKQIPESDLPLDKPVHGREPGGSVEGSNAYQLYRKLLLTLKEAGYTFRRQGAAFGLLLDSHLVFSKDQRAQIVDLQTKFFEKCKLLADKSVLDVDSRIRADGKAPAVFSTYDPLENIIDFAFNWLLTSPEFNQGDGIINCVELLIDLVPNEGKDSSDYRYFLHDWATSCTYVSEQFEGSTEETIAEQMLVSAGEYLKAIPFEMALAALSELSTNWDFSRLRLFTLNKDDRSGSGWQAMVNDFESLNVCAEPYQNYDFDLTYFNHRIDTRSKAANACQYPITVDERLLEQGTKNSPFLINGGIGIISIKPPANTDEANCFDPSDDVEVYNDNPILGDERYKLYRYEDKYGNTIIAVAFDMGVVGFNFMGGKGYLTELLIYPKMFFDNGVDSKNQINVDLTPIGFGEYNNLAYVAGLPRVLKIKDGLDVYSNNFTSDQFSEAFRSNVQKGVETASELFDLIGVVTKIIVTNTKDNNAAIKRFQKEIISLYGEDPNNFIGSSDGWIVPMHETFHVIDGNYQISSDSDFLALFKEIMPPPLPKEKRADGMVDISDLIPTLDVVNPSFMEELAENKWLGLKIDAGHPWDNEREFFASLCDSLMHPDITKRFGELSDKDKGLYIRSLEVLDRAIERTVPKAPNLTICRRIENTLEVLRPLMK